MNVHILLFIALNFIFSESNLLRSEFLTDEMINNLAELDQYERVARKIFNKYEKAKFYQIIAYTYFQKYESLVVELDLLEKQYMSVMITYSNDVDFSFIDDMPDAAIKNDFSPILFSKDSRINVKLFKAKAALFKKQYHDFVDHFNLRLNIFERELGKVKGLHSQSKIKSNYNKIYSGYESFIFDYESYNKNESPFVAVVDSNNMLIEINWIQNKDSFKRKFQYFDKSYDIKKTVDYKNEKIVIEVDYDIQLDDFISYLEGQPESYNGVSYIDVGNFSVKYYNSLNKVFKIKYFSSNGKVFGCIVKNFEEELELIDEIWYIDDCKTKVRELKNMYDPKTNKKMLLETYFK